MAPPEIDLLEILTTHNEAWNRHDLDGLMNLFADNCVFDASGGEEVCGTRYEGREDLRNAFAEVLETMPDANWGTGRHFVLAPGYGVSEWTLTGTRTDGLRVEVNGCDFLTVHDGKIVVKNSYRKQRSPFAVETT